MSISIVKTAIVIFQDTVIQSHLHFLFSEVSSVWKKLCFECEVHVLFPQIQQISISVTLYVKPFCNFLAMD